MKENIILYGATGYSGSLIAREAKKSGLKLILAGRNEKNFIFFPKKPGQIKMPQDEWYAPGTGTEDS